MYCKFTLSDEDFSPRQKITFSQTNVWQSILVVPLQKETTWPTGWLLKKIMELKPSSMRPHETGMQGVSSVVDGNQDEYIIALSVGLSIKLQRNMRGDFARVTTAHSFWENRKTSTIWGVSWFSKIVYVISIYPEDSIKDYERALRILDEINNNEDGIWNKRKKTEVFTVW